MTSPLKYDKVNIKISTIHRRYKEKTIYRRFKKFDLKKGNYKDLINKINYIIEEDKKRENKEIEYENNTKKLEKYLKEIFDKFKPRREMYSDLLIIKLNHLKIELSYDPDAYHKIEMSFDGDFKDLLKLLNKIK